MPSFSHPNSRLSVPALQLGESAPHPTKGALQQSGRQLRGGRQPQGIMAASSGRSAQFRFSAARHHKVRLQAVAAGKTGLCGCHHLPVAAITVQQRPLAYAAASSHGETSLHSSNAPWQQSALHTQHQSEAADGKPGWDHGTGMGIQTPPAATLLAFSQQSQRPPSPHSSHIAGR